MEGRDTVRLSVRTPQLGPEVAVAVLKSDGEHAKVVVGEVHELQRPDLDDVPSQGVVALELTGCWGWGSEGRRTRVFISYRAPSAGS